MTTRQRQEVASRGSAGKDEVTRQAPPRLCVTHSHCVDHSTYHKQWMESSCKTNFAIGSDYCHPQEPGQSDSGRTRRRPGRAKGRLDQRYRAGHPPERQVDLVATPQKTDEVSELTTVI